MDFRRDFFKIISKTVILTMSVLSFFMSAQYIDVTTNYTAEQLVENFIGAQNKSCITVSNVSVSGWNFGGNDTSYGYFTKGTSSFEIDEGIILSTGKALAAPGPNTGSPQGAYDPNWLGDQDLIDMLTQANLSTDNVRNATVLEFDFSSLQSNKISFDYMFLSEEYRPTNCFYSDVFAFLIKKADNTEPYKNIALIPGTNIPVTSTTINGAVCQGQDGHPEYFGGFVGLDDPNGSPTNFNGQTKLLKAIANVDKGVTYHIKLVIADHGDRNGIYDSAVFLKAGSFTGNIDIGNDLTLENANPLCDSQVYRITPTDPISDPSTKYYWFKDGVALPVPVTQGYYDVTDAGIYTVSIILGSGCKLQGSVKIEKAPKANIDNSSIMLCDSDFDGKYSAKLSSFNSQIVTNYSRDFNVSYFISPTATTPIDPDTDFVFTQNPQTLYVKVGSFSCPPDTYPVKFYFGNKLQVNPNQFDDVCDNDLDGAEQRDLADYVKLITNETNVIPTYYDSEADAKSGKNPKTSLKTIRASITYYIRIEKPGFCPNYTSIKFNFKQPKESAQLNDMDPVICKGATIDLDAGPGFDSYEWSNGKTTSEIKNVPAGEYWVKLGFNGCVYQQFVTVKEDEDPVIDNVLIEGNDITVLVSGGTPPYQYALDNGNYQSSNRFTNLKMGNHTVYVKDVYGCLVISEDFILINPINVITPNDDGINDIIDYSALLTKIDPKFEIYDRYGVLIFHGDSSNQFIWDGKQNGRPLPTSSYWYILEWNESGNPNRIRQTGWILLKNRN